MKYIPVLFSTPMVQAILDNRKTQTRRVVKMTKDIENPEFGYTAFTQIGSISVRGKHANGEYGESFIKCPYGKVGDILWVRETWANTTNVNSVSDFPYGVPHIVSESFDGKVHSAYIYRASTPDWQWLDDDGWTTEKSHWKPSIHMPKVACRLFLKIKSIRVERLQEISEQDAKAEGAEGLNCQYIGAEHHGQGYTSYTEGFKKIWQDINGRVSWLANPWVWVIEFERIEMPNNFYHQ
jgi:hypothetical protein